MVQVATLGGKKGFDQMKAATEVRIYVKYPLSTGLQKVGPS